MAALPRKAMILAAGLGTRLRPLTEAVPKPAVPICGVSPLRLNLALLASAGVEEVVVNTHWRADAIREAAGDTEELGLRVHFCHEPEILGTGGGVKNAAAHFGAERFYLVNGKILFDADLAGAAAFHVERDAVATMVLRPYPEGCGYNFVGTDSRGRIRVFGAPDDEATAPGGSCERALFTGVHILEPRVLDYLPAGEPSCIKAKAYLPMIEAGEMVCGHLQEAGYFGEPSTPARYLSAIGDLLRGELDLERFRAGGVDPFSGTAEPAPGARVHPLAEVSTRARVEPPCWVGPGAKVAEGATIGPGTVVESGALVGCGAKVVESVVWPKSEIGTGEDLYRVIATGPDRVPAD